VLRVHDALELKDVDFSLPVRPISDFASYEYLPELDDLGLGKSFFRKVTGTLTKIHKKIYHATVPAALRKVLRKVGGKLKKVLVKAAPFIAIAAQILNFIPGLGVLVGLAIMAGAAAVSVGAAVIQQKEAKKKMKTAEKQAEAQERAEEQARYEEAGKKADEAYAKGGPQYFAPKYGMTPDKWGKLTNKDKLIFLNTAVFDMHPEEAAKLGVTREAFGQMLPEEQVIVLAKLGGAGDEIFDESSPLTYIAIGAGALAIILVVYLLTRRKKA
jgi:hypothetical protein